MQGGEVIIILLLALIVLGPTRLPDVARKLGQWTAELRSAARDIRIGLEAEVDDLKGVTDDLKSIRDDVKKPLDEVKQPLDEIKREVGKANPGRMEWTGPKPVTGPTPEDAMRDLEEIERAVGEEGDS